MLDCDGDIYGKGFFSGIDDSGGPVGVDLWKGAQKKAADVGENGSAAGGNAVLCQELVEVHEGVVDALGGLEKMAPCGQVREMIGG
jgi:hypothetical protein